MAKGFPGGSVVKYPPANAGATGDMGLILGSGRSPGGGNGNPLQCSCQDNPIDRGAWWATVRGGDKESDRTEHTRRYGQTALHRGCSLVIYSPISSGYELVSFYLCRYILSILKKYM